LRTVYPENIWPDEIPELRNAALGLYRSLEQCAFTLLEALACYYDLPESSFAAMIQDGNSVLRVVHYPPLQPAAPANALRAAPHEDINFLTLLLESRGGGLEILTRDGDWIPVGALAGDLIVDSGDMLSRLTNGVIPATTHRVVNPPAERNEARYSMPFFVHPYPDCDLAVMERFTSPENPPKWEPISAGEFLEQRLRDIGMRAT
jgi:isopenicillin N synthase-like dioxygenase